MKRPLFAVALLYIGGILLGQWLRPALTSLFVISFLSCLTALFWQRTRNYFLTASLVLAGWTNQSWHTAIISPNDLRSIIGPEPEDVLVRGTLHASPIPRIFERPGRELWRSTVVIDTKEIHRSSGWQPAVGKITATVPGILDSNFFTGQLVEVSGILAPPRGPLADGLFDPRSLYQQQEIYYQLRTDSDHA